MFVLDDGRPVLSATDLTSFLACGHLAAQRLATARGERARARPGDDPYGDVLKRRGDAHELEQLARLSAECGRHVDLSRDVRPWVREELETAASATEAAMRAGAPLIFQATLFDGRWQGRADFLRRMEEPSALGEFSYEILDTKLARHVKPAVVHQLSLYSRLMAAVQGVEPTLAYVILGNGDMEAFELRRYAALHRRAIARLERMVDAPTPATFPEPIPHCDICDLAGECRSWFVEVDHLSLVAGARRDQREKLEGAGIHTLGSLAEAPADLAIKRLSEERLDVLRHQALLQRVSRDTKRPQHRQLPPERARGYALLPAPDRGDLFFDLEGDPYAGADGGIEYLWGWCDTDGAYEYVWAHDEAAEKAALERFVDVVVARRRRFPGMKVFHYAPHEKSKLQSLALRYATREDVIDQLLREEVLVDLYAVVRQGLQVGEESYSLKKLERHHGFRRLETSVREGGGSIVAYEQWLEHGDDELLEAIRTYNEEDCRSTLALRDWLAGTMRTEAEEEFGVDFAELAEPAREEPPAPPKWLEEIEPVIAKLLDGLPDADGTDRPDQAERRLLAHMLRYHQREGKPQWWRHFELMKMSPVELEDERDAIGSLRRDTSIPPIPVKQSYEYAFTFPPQEFRLSGDKAIDPTTGKSYNLARVTDTHVYLRKGVNSDPPSPPALIPEQPIDPKTLRARIAAVAESVMAGHDAFAAVRSVLRREPPRWGDAMPGDRVDDLVAAALALDSSHLAVQGPPGTGKTYRAARMVVEALRAGRRVALTAPSHAAIHNLLDAVEDYAATIGYRLRGLYKGDDYESVHGLVETVQDNKKADTDHELIAGTPWLLSRDEHVARFDLLIVDEAGQFALANLVAAGACAANLLLLGDPQQLPQVNQAQHPGGSGASVLGHLLAGRDTIEPTRGVLLRESWRMHPEITAFVSERSYDGLLRSRQACALRRVDAPGAITGAGLRTVEVAHEGCSQASEQEADAIAALCRDLLDGGTVSDGSGANRPLRAADLMVVAPYNLAVRCIRERVPDRVQVGTVDKFQGREAPVVFFAMTCSSGADVPRGLDFLFSRNRLNVAISRAQCLAVLVHSPTLLDADCRHLEAMALVDGACRFSELALLVTDRPLASA
jgi:predicted RecB family nuclease